MSHKNGRYAIVIFEEGDGPGAVSLVAGNWLAEKERKCWWPNYRDPCKITKAIKDVWPHESNWSIHPVRILGKCDNYSEGRLLARKAENSSDIQSDDSHGRGHRRPIPKRSIYESDSDMSESALETSPPRKKLTVTQRSSLCDPPLLDDIHVQHGMADRSQPTNPSPVLDTLTESKLRKAVKPVLLAVSKCDSRLDEQQKMIDKMLSLLESVDRKLENRTATTTSSPDMSKLDGLLPLTHFEEFEEFDTQLRTDDDLQKALEHRLRVLGGSSVKVSVKYIIDTLLTRQLQTQFNMEGKTGWKARDNKTKKGFKTFYIYELITRILINKEHLATDEAEVRKTIMVYLRNAADRCFGRKRSSSLDQNEPMDQNEPI